ncbi:MAG: hypothetical protein GXP29_00955 [Planctomycetes bacterium]|nr:hypothetical protein [Planctomycetota bacterium]
MISRLCDVRGLCGVVLLAVLLVGLPACSPSSKETQPAASSKPAPTPSTTPDANEVSTPPADTPSKPAPTGKNESKDGGETAQSGESGTVNITTRYLGKTRPKRKVIDMAADPTCVKANKDKKVGTENWLVNKNMTVRNVVCFVSEGQGSGPFAPPANPSLLDQLGCMYKPHVQTLMVNQPLTVRNNDATMHNIHTFAKKQRTTNFAQPKKGDQRDITFKRSEIVKIKCDVHPWMSAFVGVFDHPYHAVTRKKGVCSLNLPPGDYSIGAWHEEAGDLEPIKVTVKPGESVNIVIEVPAAP